VEAHRIIMNGNGNPTEHSAAPDAAPAADNSELDALRREADEHRDRYVRAVAELDNFRKRSAREVDAARKFGAERLAQAILPVRDSLQAGLDAAEKAGHAALLDGQRATLRLLDDALTASGVREIDPVGQRFDPSKHEALSLVPAAPGVAPDTVLEVVQKGYELNERLLRAAKVLVARADGP
jgi:molecular chaperone GrpE